MTNENKAYWFYFIGILTTATLGFVIGTLGTFILQNHWAGLALANIAALPLAEYIYRKTPQIMLGE